MVHKFKKKLVGKRIQIDHLNESNNQAIQWHVVLNSALNISMCLIYYVNQILKMLH
jgi:hypothetical protein